MIVVEWSTGYNGVCCKKRWGGFGVRSVGSKRIDRNLANPYELEGYYVADFKLAYTFNNVFGFDEKTRLMLGINNFFDETYAEYDEIAGGHRSRTGCISHGRSIFISLGCLF